MTPAELRALADEVESRECTGEVASWCPVHGTCRGCVRRDDGEWDDFDTNCPLHGQGTSHAVASEQAPPVARLGSRTFRDLPACRHCGAPVRETNYALGSRLEHYDPDASFRDAVWTHCRLTTAEMS